MKLLSRPQPPLTRSVALNTKPSPLPFLEKKEEGQSGLRVKVKLMRAGWTRWFGGPKEIERTFCLDHLGREVYEACNGQRTVKEIIRDFSNHHHISLAEAEMSVTKFLKTMMAKGLIAMQVERTALKKRKAKS